MVGLKQSNADLTCQLEALQREGAKAREAKDKAEAKADELKEKMRVMIREQQEERLALNQSVASANRDDQRTREQLGELMSMIISLNLAETSPPQRDDFESVKTFFEE